MKKEYVKLVKLIDNVYEEENEEMINRWKRNVINSEVENGYCIDVRSDDIIVKEFDDNELDCVCVDVYDFMGSIGEDERFYIKNVLVYEDNEGNKWIENREDLFEF